MAALHAQGHEFLSPSGESGYRLTRDVQRGQIPMASDFEPFGDVPKPMDGGAMPYWLGRALWPHGLRVFSFEEWNGTSRDD